MIHYFYLFVMIVFSGFVIFVNVQDKEIADLTNEVNRVEVALEVEEANHEAELFEVEQTTIFDLEKEQNVSEIPDDVGHHTIDF